MNKKFLASVLVSRVDENENVSFYCTGSLFEGKSILFGRLRNMEEDCRADDRKRIDAAARFCWDNPDVVFVRYLDFRVCLYDRTER
jgi:hypothetical protein